MRMLKKCVGMCHLESHCVDAAATVGSLLVSSFGGESSCERCIAINHFALFANVVVRTVCTQALGIRSGHSSRSAGVRYMPSMVIDHRITHLFGRWRGDLVHFHVYHQDRHRLLYDCKLDRWSDGG